MGTTTIEISVKDHEYDPPITGVVTFTKEEFLRRQVDFTVVVVNLLKKVECLRKDEDKATITRLWGLEWANEKSLSSNFKPEITPEEAQALLDDLMTKFPSISDWNEKLKQKVEEKKND